VSVCVGFDDGDDAGRADEFLNRAEVGLQCREVHVRDGAADHW
jgi:hypothetical protein